MLNKHFGCNRWIYNYALEKKIKAYKEDQVNLSRFEIQKDLPVLKQHNENQTTTIMKNNTCCNCKWWHTKPGWDATGECHKLPPWIIVHSDDIARTVWPVTYKDDWCGHHKEKLIEKNIIKRSSNGLR